MDYLNFCTFFTTYQFWSAICLLCISCYFRYVSPTWPAVLYHSIFFSPLACLPSLMLKVFLCFRAHLILKVRFDSCGKMEAYTEGFLDNIIWLDTPELAMELCSSVLRLEHFTLHVLPLGNIIRQHGISFHWYTGDIQPHLLNPDETNQFVWRQACLKDLIFCF